MRKILALYKNELTKISKKTSIIILGIIMIVGVIGLGALLKISMIQSDKYDNGNFQNEWQTRQNKENQEKLEGQLVELNKKLSLAGEEDKINVQTEIISANEELAFLKRIKEKNLSEKTYSYIIKALEKIKELNIKTKNLELLPKEMLAEQEQKTITQNKSYVEKLNKSIENESYSEYIAVVNELILSDKQLSDAEKIIEVDGNNLLLKFDPKDESAEGTFSGRETVQTKIQQINTIKKSLASNIDMSNNGEAAQLTPEKRETLENNLKVEIYKVENNILLNEKATRNSMALTMMFGFGLSLIVILIIILAGGAISSEISTGSIKSLIISPTKRWKIYFAKFLSILTVGIISGIILYAVTIGAYSALFGASTGMPYVFASGGKVGELSFYLYQFLSLCVNFIDIIVYMVFALMLSTITRNTAASVGISMAVFFGSSMGMQIINQLLHGEWLKFIPFNSLSLTARIFTFDTASASMNSGIDLSTLPSLTFSLCYLVVFVGCMAYIGLDSFNRRDIK